MRDSAITKILRARRSVYPTQFTGEIIADDIIEEILLNANYAPSHKLTRPWFFKVFPTRSNHTLLEWICSKNDFSKVRMAKLALSFERSSHIICICMRRNEILPEWEEIAATAMSVQNIWLSCVNTDIGGYWSSPGFSAGLSEFLRLEKNEKCLGLFYLGVHSGCEADNRQIPPIGDKVEWK